MLAMQIKMDKVRLTDDEMKAFVFRNTFASKEHVMQVRVILNVLAAYTLPMNLGAQFRCEVSLSEDVIGEMRELGVHVTVT